MSECSSPVGYRWNHTMSMFYLDCSKKNRSTGTNKDAGSCECSTGSLWSIDDCIIDCQQIRNSDGTYLKNSTCACDLHYMWNIKTLNC